MILSKISTHVPDPAKLVVHLRSKRVKARRRVSFSFQFLTEKKLARVCRRLQSAMAGYEEWAQRRYPRYPLEWECHRGDMLCMDNARKQNVRDEHIRWQKVSHIKCLFVVGCEAEGDRIRRRFFL